MAWLCSFVTGGPLGGTEAQGLSLFSWGQGGFRQAGPEDQTVVWVQSVLWSLPSSQTSGSPESSGVCTGTVTPEEQWRGRPSVPLTGETINQGVRRDKTRGSKGEGYRGNGERERGEEGSADGKGQPRGSHRHSAPSWPLCTRQLTEEMMPLQACRSQRSARRGCVARRLRARMKRTALHATAGPPGPPECLPCLHRA